MDFDPVTQENNAAVQVNNPNVQVAPVTQPTPATEPIAPQTTSNPANNGIVPQGASPMASPGTSAYSQDQLNTMVKELNLQTENVEGELAKLYGLQQSGITEEQSQKMPGSLYDS